MHTMILMAALAAAPLPTHWQTLYFATLTRTEGGPALSADALRMLNTLHVQYQLKLKADGNAVAGGPLGEVGADLTLICAGSADAARELVNADPLVQFGQATVTIETWRVPAGSITCPQ